MRKIYSLIIVFFLLFSGQAYRAQYFSLLNEDIYKVSTPLYKLTVKMPVKK